MARYDPTDPDAVASEERRLAREHQAALADLRAVLALAEGRRWLWRLLAHAELFRSSFDADNPARTAYREGRRGVGLWLLDEMAQADPAAFPSLVAETWAAAQTSPTEEDPD